MKPTCENGGLIWITGLSGSGKTTLAKHLLKHLQCKTLFLDGDEMRKMLGSVSCGYDYKGRKSIAFTYARLCAMIVNQGFLIVCSTISMFDEVRNWNRENIPSYCEIFMDVSEEERIRRDPKKLYADNKAKKVDNMAGIDYSVEYPKNPDIVITENMSVEESVKKIMDYLA